MIDVVVGGATGKLGRVVCELACASNDIRIVGGTAHRNVGTEIAPGVSASSADDLMGMVKDADVYVDLTTPSAASEVIADIPSTGTNVILGTTAVDRKAIGSLRENIERYGTSGIVSANFAKGVNVFWKMCELMAAYLPGYDIEVIEAHHRYKKDAPSGTAMEAVRRMQSVTDIHDLVFGREGISGPRGKEIGIHSVRAGDVFGDHTVMFAGNMELLEVKHRSVSREALANGCIESIRWIAGKKDGRIHGMNEVFNL